MWRANSSGCPACWHMHDATRTRPASTAASRQWQAAGLPVFRRRAWVAPRRQRGRRRHQSPPCYRPPRSAPLLLACAPFTTHSSRRLHQVCLRLRLSPPRRAARALARLQTVQVAPQVRVRAAEGRAAGLVGRARASPAWPLCLKLPGLAGGLTAHPTMLYGLVTGGSGLQACRRASETHAPACPQVPVPWLGSSSGGASG